MMSRRTLIWSLILIGSAALIAFAPEEEVVVEATQKALNASDKKPRTLTANAVVASSNSTPGMPPPQQQPSNSASDTSTACTQEPCTPQHQWPFRQALKTTQTDAFRPLSYAPPPPPPVVTPKVVLPPPPPPKPVAPALPFKYLGKLGNNHAVQKEDEMYELVVGQTVADQYKVESINEEQAVFTYLPLQEQQVLLLRNE